MQALVMRGPGDFGVEEWPTPVPADGEVLVRMVHAGICGSDLHYAFDGRVGNFVITEPLVAGHEVCGEVAEDPTGQFTPGTAVTVHPATYGPRDERIADEPHLWPGGSYLGSAAVTPHCQGAMAEYAVFRPDQLRVLPDGLGLRTAVLAEPLAVGLHAINRALQAIDRPDLGGQRVLVSGSGPIGLLMMAALQTHDTASVTATDLTDAALERARGLGVDHTVNVAGTSLEPESYDVVLEATGAPAALSASLAATARRGTIVQVGSLPGGPQGFDLASLVAKEVALVGTFRFDTEIDQAVRLLAANPHWEQVITHEYPLSEAREAFTIAKDSRASGKVIVTLRP
ncbi:MAG TPA: zinc-binding dehydrogenase [Candidatus Avipropionibacterium avicola]|uniref:Zinc-binding dehydrogenase n=1 Tax=Candidatus Avipropionibacterium avicola TaxID=2840701 RepID=A0A9D1GVV6_9ACTN|nr:zinc-binding dehydrogenase [Candidatus Avipropionibacterium avicola]